MRSKSGIAIVFIDDRATGETWKWAVAGPRTIDVLVNQTTLKLSLRFDDAFRKYNGKSADRKITDIGERLSPGTVLPNLSSTAVLARKVAEPFSRACHAL